MRPKTGKEIEIMREGGHRLAGVMETLKSEIEPGKTTKQLADRAGELFKVQGMQSAVKGYQGYPELVCISLNEEVVHGIPSAKVTIKAGDIVSLDLTVAYKGMIVDMAQTVFVGSESEQSGDIKCLLQGTERALMAGIDAISGDGTRIGAISSAIENRLEKDRLGIVRDLVGHGVGYGVHEDPNVPNYGRPGSGPALMEGITIAIEPMATLGSWQVDILKDGWTVVTRDGSLAAHFEHTVLITDSGADILTIA